MLFVCMQVAQPGELRVRVCVQYLCGGGDIRVGGRAVYKGDRAVLWTVDGELVRVVCC